MESYVLFLGIVLALQSGYADSSSNVPVYFSLVVSYGEYGFNSSGAIPAVNIALDYVNRTQILPGYELTYETVRDSKVSV